jgi:hypothetical protein
MWAREPDHQGVGANDAVKRAPRRPLKSTVSGKALGCPRAWRSVSCGAIHEMLASRLQGEHADFEEIAAGATEVPADLILLPAPDERHAPDG